MSHPRSDVLLDLALGVAVPEAARHVRGCGPCSAARRRLDDEQSVLRAHYATVERRPDLEERIMSSLPKPATSRAQAATRRTARASATERFHATAGKGGSPVKVLVGAIAAVFLVVVGFIVLSPRDDHEATAYYVEQALKEARLAEDSMKFDLAQAKYEEALRLMGGDDRWKTRAIEVRGWIRDAKARKADLARAEAEWKDLKAKADVCPPAEVDELLTRAVAMRERHREAPWSPSLGEVVKRLGRMQAELRIAGMRLDFQARRKKIREECALEDRRIAHWSNALRAWKNYLAEKIADVDRAKAENEMKAVLQQAREELDSVGKRAALMAEEGNRAEAVAFLKSQRGRFELTESAAALEKLIAQVDR